LLLPLLYAGAALADGATVDKASAAEKKQAGDLYAAAMKDFEDDSYEKALAGFQQSYKVVKSPNSHFMIARTYARLGRNVEAYQELDLVIKEAETLGQRYAVTVDSAREKQAEVRPRIGMLTVSIGRAPKGSRAFVGDEALAPDQLNKPIPVLPGEARVVLQTPDGTRYTELAQLQEGGQATVTLSVPEAAAKTEDEEPVRLPSKWEFGAHVVGETTLAADSTNRGAGAGARVAFQFLPSGLLGTTDSFAVITGFDYIGTSTEPHSWVPLQVQWNFWLLPRFSAMLEAGAALTFGAETRASPAFNVGLRYRVYKKLYVTGKVGIPSATLGVSLLL
jgi:hypothetical protein